MRAQALQQPNLLRTVSNCKRAQESAQAAISRRSAHVLGLLPLLATAAVVSLSTSEKLLKVRGAAGCSSGWVSSDQHQYGKAGVICCDSVSNQPPCSPMSSWLAGYTTTIVGSWLVPLISPIVDAVLKPSHDDSWKIRDVGKLSRL